MNVNFNFTYIENEVKSVPSGVEFLPGSSFGVGGNTATRFEVGFPIAILLVIKPMVFSKLKKK